jgi:hypothetical protein
MHQYFRRKSNQACFSILRTWLIYRFVTWATQVLLSIFSTLSEYSAIYNLRNRLKVPVTNCFENQCWLPLTEASDVMFLLTYSPCIDCEFYYVVLYIHCRFSILYLSNYEKCLWKTDTNSFHHVSFMYMHTDTVWTHTYCTVLRHRCDGGPGGGGLA